MSKRFLSCFLIFVVSLLAIATVHSHELEDLPKRSEAEIFAIEMLDPGIEFVHTHSRIREKIAVRLGMPDQMYVTAVPDSREPGVEWAIDKWTYDSGVVFETYSDGREWFQSLEVSGSWLHSLALGLRIGKNRMQFAEALGMDQTNSKNRDQISYSVDHNGPQGHRIISVTINFKANGLAENVRWEVQSGH